MKMETKNIIMNNQKRKQTSIYLTRNDEIRNFLQMKMGTKYNHGQPRKTKGKTPFL